MGYYVKFTAVRATDGRMAECLGSDSVYPLDGRKTLHNMREDAKRQIHRLRHVAKIDGYKIMMGERKAGGHSVCLYEGNAHGNGDHKRRE